MRNELFRRIYEYDFLTDDQRDTNYFETKEEAEEYLIERLATRTICSGICCNIYNCLCYGYN